MKLTSTLADAAATQIQFQRDAEIARLHELSALLKLAGMILASFPREQQDANTRMRQFLSWDSLGFERFQHLATSLGAIVSQQAAIAVGAITRVRDRAADVKRATVQQAETSQKGALTRGSPERLARQRVHLNHGGTGRRWSLAVHRMG